MRTYSLAFLTVSELDPVSAIYCAAENGYDAVGLRLMKASLIEPDYPLLYDDTLLAKVLEAKKETGISIGDIELIRLKPDTNVLSFEPFCKRAQILGARHVIVAGDDDNFFRISTNFKMLCELGLSYDLTFNLEPMPWTKVPNIKTALRIIEAVSMPNAGILIDPLHFHRAGDALDDIRSIPSERMNIFQICDAPALFDKTEAGLIHTARANRLFPGDGDIKLAEIISCIPQSVVISIEVPNIEMAQYISVNERVKLALEKSKNIVNRSLKLQG